MAYNFLPCDRDQGFLLPPDLREWLPADHLTWFVLDVVDPDSAAARPVAAELAASLLGPERAVSRLDDLKFADDRPLLDVGWVARSGKRRRPRAGARGASAGGTGCQDRQTAAG